MTKINIKDLPPIVEVPDKESAINFWKTGYYRSPELHNGVYHLIMKAKVFNDNFIEI